MTSPSIAQAIADLDLTSFTCVSFLRGYATDAHASNRCVKFSTPTLLTDVQRVAGWVTKGTCHYIDDSTLTFQLDNNFHLKSVEVRDADA